MKAAIKAHYWRNENYYRGIRMAVLMITVLVIALVWELKTA
ncbi:hypothetical protein [Pantoea sp. PNT02]|nr:hypothetical protein [Pantoea sp. PNT02]